MCVSVWRIWYLRNSFLFDSKVPDIKSTLGWCELFLSNYNSHGRITASPEHLADFWTPPNRGSFKLNCTSITNFRNRKTGIGLVIIDHIGFIVSSCSLFLDEGLDHITANSVAILRGLIFGKNCCLLPLYVESDATTVVSMINSENHLHSKCGNIVKDIIGLMKDLNIPTINLGSKGSYKPVSDQAKQALLRRKTFTWTSA
ncbi:hypothetical protein Dsin_024808 [Dipteronia sinensis]|uniref:RNase H type-1 domain-containing protein n=1 Tax=Dipteronia sinensis TaxID=43782 RepID=A0AAD9ZW56_9ROSI|nr:hypothetical protein Dsin_024808 [Dipteronia sinensis]